MLALLQRSQGTVGLLPNNRETYESPRLVHRAHRMKRLGGRMGR
jgi:hypothetical protein